MVEEGRAAMAKATVEEIKTSPWERLKGEGETAYEAFVAYRDLGVERSLDATALGLSGRQPGANRAPRRPGRISQWSTQFRWVERCRAWDNHLQVERDRETARRAAEWQRRRLAALEDQHEVGLKIRAKAVEALGLPLIRRRIEKDGEKTVTVIEPLRCSARDLGVLARIGIDLVNESIRGALGDSDTRDGENVDPNEPVLTRAQIEASRHAIIVAGGDYDED